MIANKDSLIDAPERRGIPTSQFDVRTAGNDLKFEGYASTFDESYDIYGGPPMGWHEVVTRDAFKKTLTEKPDLHLLINHEGMPLARTKSGTMQLLTDNHGLMVRANLDLRDPMVQSLQVKMERGDMDQMSFAFRVKKQSWSDDESHRYLDEVSLHKGDVSVVNFGANPHTNATLRSTIEFLANGPVHIDADQLAEIRSMTSLVEKAEAVLHSIRGLGSIDPDTPAIIVPDLVGTRAWDNELARQLASRDLNIPRPNAPVMQQNPTIYPGMPQYNGYQPYPGMPYVINANPEAVMARADAPPPVAADPVPAVAAPVESREQADISEPPSPTGPVGSDGVAALSSAQRTGKRRLTVAQLRAICDGKLEL